MNKKRLIIGLLVSILTTGLFAQEITDVVEIAKEKVVETVEEKVKSKSSLTAGANLLLCRKESEMLVYKGYTIGYACRIKDYSISLEGCYDNNNLDSDFGATLRIDKLFLHKDGYDVSFGISGAFDELVTIDFNKITYQGKTVATDEKLTNYERSFSLGGNLSFRKDDITITVDVLGHLNGKEIKPLVRLGVVYDLSLN